MNSRAGFTLMEIMIALAILATALFVLMQAHFAAMGLFDTARETATEQNLMRQALGMAEADMQAGNTEGAGEFGARFPGYRFSYTGVQIGQDAGNNNQGGLRQTDSAEPAVTLYDVTVRLDSPNSTKEMHEMVFVLGGGGF